MKLKLNLSILISISAVLSSYAQEAPVVPVTTQAPKPFSTSPITLIIDASKIPNWSENQTKNWCTTLESRASYKCTSPIQLSKIQDSLNRIPLGHLETTQKAEDLVGAPIWKIRFNISQTNFSRYLWFPLITPPTE
jgi:hypothetical protein